MSSPKNSGFDPVEVAISEIAKGHMAIVTDDENREMKVMWSWLHQNTLEAINHMIAHARGLICVPLLSNQLKKLGFPVWFLTIAKPSVPTLPYLLMPPRE